MRTHVKFELRTNQQVQETLKNIEESHKQLKLQEIQQQEKKRRSAWLAKVKGQDQGRIKVRAQSAPPSNSRSKGPVSAGEKTKDE
jgi:hypothetical protein